MSNESASGVSMTTYVPGYTPYGYNPQGGYAGGPPGIHDKPSILRDLTAMTSNYFGKLPLSEVFARRYYGRNLDLMAIEDAIRNAELGIMAPLSDLSREALRNDPAMTGAVQKRIASLASADWDLTPASGVDETRAKQMAVHTRRALLGLEGFHQTLSDLAWGVWDGRAASETTWRVAPPRGVASVGGFGEPQWSPESIGWIHPGRLSFGPQRELRVVERHRQTNFYYAVGPALQEFPKGKFIWWTPRKFSDYPEREGLAPRAMYWAFFKRFSWRYRMVLTELFALPWRIIERDKDAPASDQGQDQPEAMDDDVLAAEAMGGTSVFSGRPGVRLKVEQQDPKMIDFFSMTSKEVDEQMRLLINGQMTTMEGSANRASAAVAQTDEDALRKMDTRGLDERIQAQLVNVFVETNYGTEALQYAPTFQLRTDPPRDRKSEIERVEKVLSFGVPVSENEVYEISGLRKPMHGETVIRMAPKGSGGEGGASSGGPAGPAGAPTPSEQKNGAAGTPEEMVDRVLDLLDQGLLDEPLDEGQTDGEVEKGLGRLRMQRASLARQPETLHGSPESLVERGTREGVKATAKWASALVDAMPTLDAANEPSEVQVYQRVLTATSSLDLEAMARAVERRLVHGLMLGALDSEWEATYDGTVAPAPFNRSMGVRLDERDDRDETDVGSGGGPIVPPAPPSEPPSEPPTPSEPPPDSNERVKGFATKPFAEAVRAFAAKQVLARREFERLAAAAKQRAFTVAKLARDEMIDTVKDELTKTITAGEDLRTFRTRLADRFESAGWTKLNPSHVETVFRNGVMGAYSSGRRAQMKQPAVLALRPYWQILGVNDSRTRPSHRALHGKVIPATDGFWSSSQPPWGHNCRCRVVSRSAADVQRMGLQLSAGASIVGIPDEGWDSSDSAIG